MTNISKPLLSVCLITYNHCQFIRQAIDGVLMQKVNFEWEFIIADDFSTDGTRDIIKEYAKKTPPFIRLILQEKNVGAIKNWLDLMSAPMGKYVAYFEGDDYWTDPFKLQKQVDFLEQNPKCTMCFHKTAVMNNKTKEIFSFQPDINEEKIFTLEDFGRGNMAATSSVVFRSETGLPIPEWFYKIALGDYALHLINLSKGDAYYLPQMMSVYRITNSGIYHGELKKKNGDIKILLKYINLIQNVKKHLFHGVIPKSFEKMNWGYHLTILHSLETNPDWTVYIKTFRLILPLSCKQKTQYLIRYLIIPIKRILYSILFKNEYAYIDLNKIGFKNAFQKKYFK